jgi:hypothetical protein
VTAPDFPPLIPGAGPLAITSPDDVRKQMPDWMVRALDQPVTDALVEGLYQLVLAYQHEASYAAAQSDILRATDQYLDGLGQDRGYERAEGEKNEDFRSRVLNIPDLATGWAIRLVVNGILAAYTTSEAQVFDATLDRWFVAVSSPTAIWRSFLNRNPEYPDRLYEQDEAENGAAIPNNEPKRPRLFSDALGRQFMVIVPDLAGLHDDPACIYSSALQGGGGEDARLGGIAMHLGAGTGSVAAAFLVGSTATAETVYQAIVNAVERIRGHSVRWILMTDPSL